MKIGIITFHWATNYGAILQAYCLQEKLKDMGHDAEIINYKPSNYDFSWLKYIKYSILDHNFKKGLTAKKKENILEAFRRLHLRLTKRYKSSNELSEIANKYNAIISGSDQILNPSFVLNGEGAGVHSSAYFLKFAANDTKKIGYATSFGCVNYPAEAASIAKEWIKNFDTISVRENTGVDVLHQLAWNKQILVVPDPTILYGRSLFNRLKVNIPTIREDRFCVYMLRSKFSIECPALYIDNTTRPYSMSEWLSIIVNSKALITNSYHGMVMAILSHTPFIVLLESGTSSGMNDRFVTLLSILGLQDRIVHNSKDLKPEESYNKTINWESVDLRLIAYREIGAAFLKKSLI